MNILLLSGSPRKNGNTNAIVQRVAERLKTNHNVEICRITDYQINGAITAKAFWINPAVCRMMM